MSRVASHTVRNIYLDFDAAVRRSDREQVVLLGGVILGIYISTSASSGETSTLYQTTKVIDIKSNAQIAELVNDIKARINRKLRN